MTTAAGAVAAISPASDSELLALADRYWALRREYARLDDSAKGKSDAEWDAIYDRVGELDDEAFEIADRIVDLRANTPKGLAAKLRIIRLEAGYREDTKQPECHSRYDQAVALGLWTAREDALALSGAAVASGAVVAATVQENQQDPVIALRNERKRTLKDFYAQPDTDEAEDVKDALVTRACGLAARMLETEPNTLAGALAQVEQLCHWEEEGVVIGGDLVIRRLIEVLPERIEHLAGRAES